MIDKPNPSTRVTVEDLLRLKRAERPPAEFWVDFERNLRAKQLAAIVDRRPWWRTWSNLSRWSLPLGAAAALTVTVVTISHSRPQSLAPEVARATPAPAPAPTAVVVAQQEPSSLASLASDVASAPVDKVAPISMEAPATEVAVAEPVRVNASEAATAQPEATVETPPAVQLASVSEQVAGMGVDGARAPSESSQFASVSRPDPAAVRDLNSYFEHAVAHLDSRLHTEKTASVEPLTQIQTPRDARRARLLAYASAIDTHSPQYSDATNVIRSRERITSHLNEEALYDSIRRLGLKNGGVSIQF